jgi:hypothetical protein
MRGFFFLFMGYIVLGLFWEARSTALDCFNQFFVDLPPMQILLQLA